MPRPTGNMADTGSQQCEPVFVTARALPSLHVLPDTIDMCRAAENTSGRGSIRGAQRIRGLWRIYPRRQEARDKLLLEGMNLWGTQVSLLPKNPFTLQDQNNEKPATKLWVGNVPLSVDDNIIETALKKLGCEMRSTVRKELARDKNGKLTNWETGRRFVFITVPTTPLPKMCTMGIFSAELYHREMKEKRDESRKKCANCLLPDHAAATCTNPVVCLACFRPGHRRSECDQPLTGTRSDPADLDQERGETPDTISPDPPQAPPSPSPDPETIPPSQEVFDSATCSAPREGGRKGRKKKEKGRKIQAVLDAVFHPSRDAANKRQRQRGSSSEREEEEKSKRLAARAGSATEKNATAANQEMEEGSGTETG